jgi:hypothetical protein
MFFFGFALIARLRLSLSEGFLVFSQDASSSTCGASKVVHIARIVKKEVAWQCLRSGRVQRHLWRVD